MGLFGDNGKKSWQRLSFKGKQTKADQLAKEQSRSRRLSRLLAAVAFTALVVLLIGFAWLPANELRPWLGLAGLVGLVHLLTLQIVRAYHRDLLRRLPTFFLIVGAFLVLARAILAAGDDPNLPYLVPLPLLAFVLGITFGGTLAIHATLATAMLFGLMVAIWPHGATAADSIFATSLGVGAGGSVATAVAVIFSQFVGGVVAVLGCARLRNRTRLVIVGLAAGSAQFLAVAAAELCLLSGEVDSAFFESFEWSLLIAPTFALINGVASGMIITAILPFLERWLDLTTDMRLLELADQNRPVLRHLALLAPGSFQHSLMVGQLAEEAAQSIGANDLLARVGALYHDIGKMKKPNYFVENTQGDENIHDRLSPEMSRLIIISHVKDGIKIAEEEGLPKPIVDMIPMHHGTSVVEYFFRKKRQQEEDLGHGETGNEAFQYPGPKPTFKEAGILMLADNVEAISRVLQDPTPAHLRTMVKEVIRRKMDHGQLDDCALTMNDLHRIEDAFVRVLASIHHGRIKYPTQDGEAPEVVPAGTAADGSEAAKAEVEVTGSKQTRTEASGGTVEDSAKATQRDGNKRQTHASK